MKTAVFDIHHFEKPIFQELNLKFKHDLTYFEARITEETMKLAEGFAIVCSFANDRLNASVLKEFKNLGVKLVALRSAGFNNVDVAAAEKLAIKIVRVPAYSPYAVAEHATTLLMALNRKICRASARVRELNFSLDGLVGFDMHGKTVGIIGTGRIGSVMAGRGAIIDARALIAALKDGQVGSAGLDVYEEEENIFFQDLSDGMLQDDILARLMTFPNVLITAHQAFLTHEALHNITETTLQNISDFKQNLPLKNEVRI